MPMYTYRVLVTCDRNDIGPVARRFIEGEMFEIPMKINSPKFELMETHGEEPVKKEKLDPELQALNKARAAKSKTA